MHRTPAADTAGCFPMDVIKCWLGLFVNFSESLTEKLSGSSEIWLAAPSFSHLTLSGADC